MQHSVLVHYSTINISIHAQKLYSLTNSFMIHPRVFGPLVLQTVSRTWWPLESLGKFTIMSQPIKVDLFLGLNCANIFSVVVLVRLPEVTVLCCSLKLHNNHFLFVLGFCLPFRRILRSFSI